MRLASLLLLAACSETFVAPVDALAPGDAFDGAEAKTGVPTELLLAISKVETGVQPIIGLEEFPGQAPAFGVMGLRGANLTLAAQLSGQPEELVRTDVAANTLAAATLLAAWGVEAGIDTDDLAAWAPIVARYSGIADPEAAASYVWDQVYAALQEGVSVEGYASEPVAVEPRYPRPQGSAARTGDAGAVWSASPNYNSRSGAAVDFVIVHTCEGSYSGCWGWLVNPSAGVSAHYVVNESGSEVRQLVDEGDRAWHVGASYDCDLNSGKECQLDGTSTNTVSVGIEHAGYANQSSWPSGQISRSAELACGITQRHGIPRDSYHIVGHGQLQPYNRIDPGPNWPWTSYLDQVRQECGDNGTPGTSGTSGTGETTPPATGSPTAGQFVIDSNNTANDLDWYSVEVSGDWWGSTSTPGYWNTGYWVAPTEGVSDPAMFWFQTDAERCYTVEAWWTAGTNRSPAITWLGWDEYESEVGRKVVNQQIDGGKWNVLGDWTFPAGWNRVNLSRWTTAGYYAVADAVRLTPCD